MLPLQTDEKDEGDLTLLDGQIILKIKIKV